MASHSNAWALSPHYRNLKDEQIRALGERGGLIGINFYSSFLSATFAESWQRAEQARKDELEALEKKFPYDYPNRAKHELEVMQAEMDTFRFLRRASSITSSTSPDSSARTTLLWAATSMEPSLCPTTFPMSRTYRALRACSRSAASVTRTSARSSATTSCDSSSSCVVESARRVTRRRQERGSISLRARRNTPFHIARVSRPVWVF